MKTKLLLASVILTIFLCNVNNAQEQEKKFQVHPSFGFGFGFFNPQGVNDFIADDLPSFTTTTGTTDLIMYFPVRGSVMINFGMFGIEPVAEAAFAPKYIMDNYGSTYSYLFSRYSGGMYANLGMKVSRRFKIYFGVGAMYSYMSFKDYKAACIGPSLQTKFDLDFKRIHLQPFIGFNMASAENGIELNYTGGHIGIGMAF